MPNNLKYAAKCSYVTSFLRCALDKVNVQILYKMCAEHPPTRVQVFRIFTLYKRMEGSVAERLRHWTLVLRVPGLGPICPGWLFVPLYKALYSN